MIAASMSKPNFVSVKIGEVVIWFSYSTPVVVQVKGEKVATEVYFSETTERHIKSTGAKRNQERFDSLLKKVEKMYD